jgi:hypothetical protein
MLNREATKEYRKTLAISRGCGRFVKIINPFKIINMNLADITLEELNEGYAIFNSRSLYIIHQVLGGRKISPEVWEELQNKHFGTLKNIIERLPDSQQSFIEIKKKVIDLLLVGNKDSKLSVNDLRRLSEGLKTNPTLLKYLLDGFVKNRKIPGTGNA